MLARLPSEKLSQFPVAPGDPSAPWLPTAASPDWRCSSADLVAVASPKSPANRQEFGAVGAARARIASRTASRSRADVTGFTANLAPDSIRLSRVPLRLSAA